MHDAYVEYASGGGSHRTKQQILSQYRTQLFIHEWSQWFETVFCVFVKTQIREWFLIKYASQRSVPKSQKQGFYRSSLSTTRQTPPGSQGLPTLGKIYQEWRKPTSQLRKAIFFPNLLSQKSAQVVQFFGHSYESLCQDLRVKISFLFWSHFPNQEDRLKAYGMFVFIGVLHSFSTTNGFRKINKLISQLFSRSH